MTPELRIGDTVIWRGGWGTHAPVEAVVRNIVKTDGRDTDGESVESLPWSAVEAGFCVVDLENDHWAYGFQLERK